MASPAEQSPSSTNESTTPRVTLAAIQALRPKQWTKNGLLFAALVFSMRFTELDDWIRASVGFVVFCLISSSGYLYNDIRDREADRLHPSKKRRPIASGRLPVRSAKMEMVLVFVTGMALAAGLSVEFLVITILYFATTTSYTLIFKHYVILDVMFIAAGFLWRAAAGAVAIEVNISAWLLLCTAFLALFLGFNKRRAEIRLLSRDAQEHRRNLAEYTPEMVLEFQAITTSGTIISYALYTVLASRTPWLLLTLPYVLYGVFRYIYLVNAQGEGGAPDETLLSDRPILLNCALFAVTAAIILYGVHVGWIPEAHAP